MTVDTHSLALPLLCVWRGEGGREGEGGGERRRERERERDEDREGGGRRM